MLYIRRVVGQSMLPTLRPGQICLFVKSHRFKDGDIVLAHADGRPVVKRAHKKGPHWQLRGDNYQATNVYVVSPQARENKLVGRLMWPRRQSQHASL